MPQAAFYHDNVFQNSESFSERQNILLEPRQAVSSPMLMEYGWHVLNHTVPPVMDRWTEKAPAGPLPLSANCCVSPLTAARAWGLLALASAGKTEKSILKTLSKILGVDPDYVHEAANAENSRWGAVIRFFAEYPKDAVLNTTRQELMNKFYAHLNHSPLRRLCFSCDHDGLRSIHDMNTIVSNSSAGRLSYVVREEDAPNRRTLTALVSAVDCTFHWKHDGPPLSTSPMFFHDAGQKSVVNAWKVSGEFCFLADGSTTVLKLQSHAANIELFLYSIAETAEITSSDFLQAIAKVPSEATQTTICIPSFSVATPLRLKECSLEGPYNFKRVFDREKADLSGYLERFHSFSPNLTTLWDHYHKAMFTIVDKPFSNVNNQSTLDRLQVGFESRNRNTQSPWLWNPDLNSQRRKYHEDFLAPPPNSTTDGINGQVKDMEGDLVFNSPFYFMVVQNMPSNDQLVQCMGYFNNLDAVNPSAKDIAV